MFVVVYRLQILYSGEPWKSDPFFHKFLNYFLFNRRLLEKVYKEDKARFDHDNHFKQMDAAFLIILGTRGVRY